PHDVSNAIGCADCHAAAGGQPVDYACETCHTNSTGRDYDKLNAPAVPNHAHSGTASFYRGSGDFTLACWDCHQIHQQPAAQPLVAGAFTQWWDGGGEMLFNLNGFTVYDERSGQPVDCATSDNGWCEPAHWMQKTWQQFPYDPACEDPASAPPTVDCSNPVSPGERGLILWVTYASGRRASFELTYASATQLVAKGTVPTGETLASNATFALRYGMLVRTDLDPLGFCSPEPQGKFCYDTTSFPYTYNEGCGSNSDCPNGQTCQPRNYPVRCRNDADCPPNSTCQMLQIPPSAAEFNGPGTEADPSSPGICQVCHVNTGHWRRDGSGADHHNGEICTACHLHRTAPTGTCLGCHDLLGAHQKHIAQNGRGYACAECHMGGGSGDGLLQVGFSNLGMLSDGATQTGEGSVYHPLQNDRVFQATNGTQLAPVPAWYPSLKTCANVYCHSQAKRQIQGYDLPSLSASWDAGSSDIQGDGFTCNDCHAHPPTFDAHKSHHSRNFSCEICHAATAATATSLLAGGNAHVNGVYDVVPAGEFYARGAWHALSFQYTSPVTLPGSGTCSSNTCHQYYRYKDPAVWRNEEQVIRNAALQYTQGGSCASGAATGALSAGVVVDCPDCAPPYTCDFVWGDGSADSNVPCTFSHTYADIVPNGTPYDPNASAIGRFAVTWAVRDSYGISLAEGTRTTPVQVCPYPNVAPVPNFTTALGPDPNKYDLCLTDRSTDADYNVGTHYDPANPPTYAAPGQIKIDWGGYAADGSGKGLSQQAAMLTALPGNQAYCFTYDRSGYYYIRHSVMDNAGQWVASPVRVVKVSR
ncbi:MAG: CxxxxCH/CxxCH domain-containing protein, partial [Thermodesulfobacteriota bacterium]